MKLQDAGRRWELFWVQSCARQRRECFWAGLQLQPLVCTGLTITAHFDWSRVAGNGLSSAGDDFPDPRSGTAQVTQTTNTRQLRMFSFLCSVVADSLSHVCT